METIILFAPLVASLIAGFGWRIIGDKGAQWLTTAMLMLAAVLSWVVFLTFDGQTQHIQILRWIESGSLSSDWSIRLDRLTAIMLIVVTTVSSLVHIYSMGTWPMTKISVRTKAIAPAFLLICRCLPSRC